MPLLPSPCFSQEKATGQRQGEDERLAGFIPAINEDTESLVYEFVRGAAMRQPAGRADAGADAIMRGAAMCGADALPRIHHCVHAGHLHAAQHQPAVLRVQVRAPAALAGASARPNSATPTPSAQHDARHAGGAAVRAVHGQDVSRRQQRRRPVRVPARPARRRVVQRGRGALPGGSGRRAVCTR